MKELIIYEGGKMGGLSYEEMIMWRLEFSNEITIASKTTGTQVRVINPVFYYNFENQRHNNDFEIMQFDLNKVRQSDLLIVQLEGLNTSIGTCIEIYEAYKNNIPVLLFGNQELFDNLHPWIKCCITRHDLLMQDTIYYIRDFYLI